jgi:ACR3 family arsenite efflux pump ArsB
MSVLSKLQPVFIVVSALLGAIAGKLNPHIERYAGSCIEIFLVTMLFFVFLSVDMKLLSKSFMNVRFSLSALAINFVWTPVFVCALSKIFLPGQTDLQIGFIMLMVTPCTDWYLIFTGLANGNVPLGFSLLPLNLLLQIVLLPAYLFLCMGTVVSFDGITIVQSIVFVLLLPLLASTILKIVAKAASVQRALKKTLSKSDDIQFALLCLAIIAMFASHGSALLDHAVVFVRLLPPLMLFFIVTFILSLFVGKKLKLPFHNIIPLIFTTSARNSPIALAIAAIAFPLQPIVSLALVMGPLIELPVLAINAALLKRMGKAIGAS